MSPDSENDVTRLLHRVNDGDGEAVDALLTRIHSDLVALARRHMDGQGQGHTLQPSALVNEAYLRVFRGVQHDFEDRRHFLALASRAMRSVLVDHARTKQRAKRQPTGERVALDGLVDVYEERSNGLIELEVALEKLARIEPRLVQVVELRFFGGHTTKQTAEVLGLTQRTVEREWTAARAWLKRELG